MSLSVYGFSGSGSGNSTDPYLITTCLQLNETRDSLGAYYKLSNDIQCKDTKNWDGNQGFEPIGGQNSSAYFYGNFNGNGKAIISLYINRSTTNKVGLFGQTGDAGYTSRFATITNLTLYDVNITGQDKVGALIGDAEGSFGGSEVQDIVSYVRVHGNVYGRANVGGMIGHLGSQGGIQVSKSLSEANVYFTDMTSASYVGGFIGYVGYLGIFQDTYSTGNLSCYGCVGDINTRVGGFAGQLFQSQFNRSYATGFVPYSSNRGGYSYLNDSGANRFYQNLFYDNQTTNMSVSNSASSGKNTVAMKQQVTFTNFDFTNVWNISENVSYPTLRGISLQTYPVVSSSNFSILSNTYGSFSLNNYVVSILNNGVTTQYATTTKQINTTIPSSSGLVNITIWSFDGVQSYLNFTILNYDVTNNLTFNYTVLNITIKSPHNQQLVNGVQLVVNSSNFTHYFSNPLYSYMQDLSFYNTMDLENEQTNKFSYLSVVGDYLNISSGIVNTTGFSNNGFLSSGQRMSGSLNRTFTGTNTINFFLKKNDTLLSDVQCSLIQLSSSSSSDRTWIGQYYPSTGFWHLTQFKTGFGYNRAFSNLPIPSDTQWHMYTFSMSGGNTNYYIDGVFNMTSSAPTFTNMASELISLDYSVNDQGCEKVHSLDEMSIFTRGLSASEISNIYTRYQNQSRNNYIQLFLYPTMSYNFLFHKELYTTNFTGISFSEQNIVNTTVYLSTDYNFTSRISAYNAWNYSVITTFNASLTNQQTNVTTSYQTTNGSIYPTVGLDRSYTINITSNQFFINSTSDIVFSFNTSYNASLQPNVSLSYGSVQFANDSYLNASYTSMRLISLVFPGYYNLSFYNLSGNYKNSFYANGSTNVSVSFYGLTDDVYEYNFSFYITNSSHVTYSSTRNFTIDTTLPTQLYNYPTLSDGIEVNQTFIYVNSTVNDINFANQTLYVYRNQTLNYTISSPNATATWNVTGLDDASYYYFIDAYDKANNNEKLGNRSIKLNSLSVITGFDSSSDASGYITKNSIFVNVTSGFTSLSNITIYLYYSNNTLVSSAFNTSNNATVTFTGLMNQSYIVNATSYSIGNIKSVSVDRPYYLSTASPNISFVQTSCTQNANCQLRFTIIDGFCQNGMNASSLYVNTSGSIPVILNGQLSLLSSVTTSFSSTCQYESTVFSPNTVGSHTLTVYVQNKNGYSSFAAGSFNVSAQATPSVPPTGGGGGGNAYVADNISFIVTPLIDPITMTSGSSRVVEFQVENTDYRDLNFVTSIQKSNISTWMVFEGGAKAFAFNISKQKVIQGNIKYIRYTLIVPPGTALGDYNGYITVSSGNVVKTYNLQLKVSDSQLSTFWEMLTKPVFEYDTGICKTEVNQTVTVCPPGQTQVVPVSYGFIGAVVVILLLIGVFIWRAVRN